MVRDGRSPTGTLLGFAAMLALWMVSAAAHAQNEATLSTARRVATQGLQAYDAGRYQEAAEKLERAFKAVPMPTLALNAARSLVRIGRLVKASELYMAAIRLRPASDWTPAQHEAQASAKQERDALLPRIPRLNIILQGATPEEIQVSIDDSEVASSLVLEPQVVDPGKRRVRGKKGALEIAREVTLAESAEQTVTLDFSEEAAVATAPVAGVQPRPPTQASVPNEPEPSHRGQRRLGWIGVGIGGAGVVAGVVTGILVATKRDALLDDGCNGVHCDVSNQDQVDSYNTLRTISTVSFVAGGLFAAAGVTLLLTAPKDAAAPTASLFIGPGSTGVAGRF